MLLAEVAQAVEAVAVAQISTVFVEAVQVAVVPQGKHLASLLHPLKR
jgi:hypothetical protein